MIIFYCLITPIETYKHFRISKIHLKINLICILCQKKKRFIQLNY